MTELSDGPICSICGRASSEGEKGWRAIRSARYCPDCWRSQPASVAHEPPPRTTGEVPVGPRPRPRLLRALFGKQMAEVEDARDGAYVEFVDTVGGFEKLVALVQQHSRLRVGREMGREEALFVIEGWRRYGVIRRMSIGEYLDQYHAAD